MYMMYKQLTAAGRGAIEVLLLEQYTVSEIARKLGVHVATVSREIKNRGTPMGYFADIAQDHYTRMRLRCRKRKKLDHSHLQKHLCNKLEAGWSPEQIAGRLKREQSPWYVCKETIYQFLYTDPWAKGEALYQYLRYGRKKRRKQTGRSVHCSKIPNRVSIHERPTIVTARSEFGHCEADSVLYAKKRAINTINDLASGMVWFTKLEQKTAIATARALITTVLDVGIKTITVDNGTEFMEHERVTAVTRVPVFFADPYCSNQRGANENVNMLLRGYLPKRATIEDLTQEELNDIAQDLNNRPRKRFGYKTPNEQYQFLLQSKGGSSVAVGTGI